MQLVRFTFVVLYIVLPLQVGAGVSPEKCHSEGWSRKQLHSLTQSVPPDASVQALALQLRHCLAATDPVLRDKIGFGLLSQWMRNGRLTDSTRTQLFSQLTADIAAGNDVNDGVYLPFALLTLSEVLRTDRLSAFLSEKQRDEVIRTVSDYLATLTDYRGFSEDVGWRHNVAHGADVYLQLGLNNNVTARQLRSMSDSVADLINPAETHYYHFGEPQRLARATAYMMVRNGLSVEYWQRWLNTIAAPAPFETWGHVFTSQRGLAKRHNVRAFLLELARIIRDSNDQRLIEINEPVDLHLNATA